VFLLIKRGKKMKKKPIEEVGEEKEDDLEEDEEDEDDLEEDDTDF